jgi:hypothetical protein
VGPKAVTFGSGRATKVFEAELARGRQRTPGVCGGDSKVAGCSNERDD